jgi:hypothetical protein
MPVIKISSKLDRLLAGELMVVAFMVGSLSSNAKAWGC